VALPGIGIALALHIHPVFGAVAMLLFGAVLVWALQERAREATETMIGVVFSAALAVGSLITSGDSLLEALLGGAGTLTWPELLFGLVGAAGVMLFIVMRRNGLVVMLVSPDLARTAGVGVERLNLLYLLMFALTIALGLRYLGVLLMGALIIIPAATAKRLARNLNQMLLTAVALAVLATVVGTSIGAWLGQETGPFIVLVAACGFLISLLRR
jgi:zinc transport system permease protein